MDIGGKCKFEIIPDEVIVRIFSHLQPAVFHLRRASTVCSRWHRLARDPSLWIKLILPACQCSPERVKKKFGKLIKIWTKVSFIDLSGCSNAVDDDFLRYIGENCHKLTHLNLSGCRLITDTGLLFLGDGCKKVKCLIMHACPEVSCQGVAHVAKHCVNLEELTVSDCDGLWRDPHKMRTISTYCTRLKKFNVSWSITARGIVVDLDIKHFAMYCTQLKMLNIRSCQITDNGLRFLARYCTLLEHLDLGHCFITDNGLKCRFPRLRYLDLSGCWHITDEGVKYIAINNANLHFLNLSWCFRITDIGIEYVATNLRFLQHLNVGHCFTITNRSVQNIAQQCKELRSLSIRGDFLITDAALKYLAERLTKTLYELDIEACTRVTNEGIAHVYSYCPRIKIDTKDCKSVNSQATYIYRPITYIPTPHSNTLPRTGTTHHKNYMLHWADYWSPI